MERLWGYYDLQIRRYMPMTTYRGFLSELSWKTGAFEGFGSYTCFDETVLAPDDAPLKTHVLHLCMERQDLDLYFTHKNAEDDWEIMAVEFVFAGEQEIINAGDTYAELLAQREQERQQAVAVTKGTYTETEVAISEGDWALSGTLTMPDSATEDALVPAVVLVHDDGAHDRDETEGDTKLFADIAHSFAEQGIAVLRYDKRSFVYPEQMAALNSPTVQEDVIRDAILAMQLLRDHKLVDRDRIFLVGHGLGAMLAPRIVSEARRGYCGMILMNGSPKTLLDVYIAREKAAVAALPADEQAAAMEALSPTIELCGELSEGEPKDAKALELFGRNGYYYYEMDQTKYDAVTMITRRALPTLVISGGEDTLISPEDGYYAYENALLSEVFVSFRLYKGLDHWLMPPADGARHLDERAAQTMIDFIKER